jgi:hypothetical protein
MVSEKFPNHLKKCSCIQKKCSCTFERENTIMKKVSDGAIKVRGPKMVKSLIFLPDSQQIFTILHRVKKVHR